MNWTSTSGMQALSIMQKENHKLDVVAPLGEAREDLYTLSVTENHRVNGTALVFGELLNSLAYSHHCESWKGTFGAYVEYYVLEIFQEKWNCHARTPEFWEKCIGYKTILMIFMKSNFSRLWITRGSLCWTIWGESFFIWEEIVLNEVTVESIKLLLEGSLHCVTDRKYKGKRRLCHHPAF